MPTIEIERVVSVSSEDSTYQASNLLGINCTNTKWKCKTPGEKNISTILQLKKAYKIVALEIGNEHSAFIEILVGRLANLDDWKPLLVTTSLMSLQEAKNGDNINGVKFFKSESFCKTVKNEKWDSVKLICSQPYNKYVQFGLAFIVFHTEEVTDIPMHNLGKFQLKIEKHKHPLLQTGGLFAQRKELNQLTGAAAVHAVHKHINDIRLPLPVNKTVLVVNPVASDEIHDDVQLVKDLNSITIPNRQKIPKVKRNTEKKNISPATPTSSITNQKTKNELLSNSMDSQAKPFKKQTNKPFNKLLENVVFVISGFQNPLRCEIRSKGLAMGAKYKADWDSSCTHLICAFINTPKYNQVRTKGKIVKKEWMEESYAKRVAFPWRRYALDPNDQFQEESDEEIYENIDRPTAINIHKWDNVSDSEDIDELDQVVTQKKEKLLSNKLKEAIVKHQPTTPISAAVLATVKTPSTQNDVYDMETEEEDFGIMENDSEENLPHLPEFFKSKTFLLLDSIDVEEKAKLKRYIIAHKGVVASGTTDLNKVDFVLSEDAVDVAMVKSEYPGVIGVKPEWVWRSHDSEGILPLAKFEIP